jgi:hypothetical protein
MTRQNTTKSILSRHARTWAKRAELGGDGQDTQFEQAFSNLAHAYLRDKAPSLLDYEVGFQLLERNQDNTKAVGMFGFKVGEQWLYAPVFFLNGDLKGHELLYLKDQDLFVPMKENWLTYIINRRPFSVGKETPRNIHQLGVTPPDFYQFTQSPNKFASAMEPWAQDILPVFAHAAGFEPDKKDEPLLKIAARRLKEVGESLHLPTWLEKHASLRHCEYLVKMMQSSPKLAGAIKKHHGLDFIGTAIKSAKARRKAATPARSLLQSRPSSKRASLAPRTGSILKQAAADGEPDVKNKVNVITHDLSDQTLPVSLTDQDRAKLLRDGYLIRDHRNGEEVSVAYNLRVNQKLQNPTETGIHYILTKPGKFEKCLVIMAPKGPNGRKTFCTVIRLEGKRDWISTHPSNVWVGSHGEEIAGVSDQSLNDWLETQPEATSFDTGDKAYYVVVGPRGEGTLPFKVKKSKGTAKETKCYEVSFETYANRDTPHYHPRNFDRATVNSTDYDDDYCSWNDGERIHLDSSRGTRLRSSKGDVWVPKGFRKIKVRECATETARNSKDPCCAPDGQSEDAPLLPGNQLDLELQLYSKTAALTIWSAAGECEINRNRMSLKSGLVHLVKDHGFREKVAKAMIKEAQAKTKKTFRIKYAQPYLTNQGPEAPTFPAEPYTGTDPFMGSQVPTQQPTDFGIPIPGMQGTSEPNAYYPLHHEPPASYMAEQAEGAVDPNQKEVLDTAVIGTLLKSVRDDNMVDQHMKDLMKGMDKLGRILFLFYWHGDKFQDRYGKEDMPEPGGNFGS